MFLGLTTFWAIFLRWGSVRPSFLPSELQFPSVTFAILYPSKAHYSH